MKPKQRINTLSALVLCGVSALSACSNDIVPAGAVLSITPNDHSTRIVEQQRADGSCLYDASRFVDIPVLLQLSTADGSPIGDATLKVYADYAANTFSGLATLALFDDLNSNGVVDETTELISARDDDIASVKTDTWSGARSLLLRINLSCAFRGELFAYSGGASGRASIEVIAESTEQPEIKLEN